jgi:transcriptional regulator with XRE-family HTH domain
MKFSEKVRQLRKEQKLSQTELGKAVGVSGRSVAAWEAGNSYPRYQETYDRLARLFNVDVNYLRTENESFMEDVRQQYGTRAQQQARALLEQANELFAGGELSEEDKLSFLTEMQQLFLDAKKRAQKYSVRKKGAKED